MKKERNQICDKWVSQTRYSLGKPIYYDPKNYTPYASLPQGFEGTTDKKLLTQGFKYSKKPPMTEKTAWRIVQLLSPIFLLGCLPNMIRKFIMDKERKF